MDNFSIKYKIMYREKYFQNLINIKFIYNNYLIFNFETLYSRFYELFVQNYNSNYYYCQLSKNCELEIEDTPNGKILNFILMNEIDDEIKNVNRMNFSIKMNETFYLFLERLKDNHCKVIKNSKW
jgi:hypothetical protein